ncbi:MAG TPA: Gfo/Idh/MocA family oxidoreductase [Candidatus Limnocylindrales bacterium]|nr:Gfo/Idh/MocA family oxidoreductase [Candidatus Limnocylindrales bacterium]
MKGIVCILAAVLVARAADIRIGIIGTDTSHVPAFTAMLNSAPGAKDHVSGARVVAAYKGGSKDIESSISRVDQYAAQIHDKYGVEIVGDIPSLLAKCDAVILASVDGRVHLEQARPVIAAHKPLFIDKPLASTLEDAREIARLAKAAGVPWFSSSSLRFGAIAAEGKFGDTQGVMAWGPGPLEPHHQLDLTWYAIHPIEILYTLMGPGVETVTRITSDNADVIVGKWKDGRLGTVRAIRPYSEYGAIVFREKEVVEIKPQTAGSYRPLVEQIVAFFETKTPPVPNEETLEIFAFMDAAQRSKEQGGKAVALR